MDNSSKIDKKKRKAYYRKCAAKRVKLDGNGTEGKVPKNLMPGMTGFLVTCNRQERLALMETFRMLNAALERFTGKPSSPEPEKLTDAVECPLDSVQDVEPTDEEEEDDIFSQLKQENLRSQTSPGNRRYDFYSARTGVSNCLFVAHYSKLISSNALAHRIFTELLESKECQSRNVLRFMPVACTCTANANDISRSVEVLWQSFISKENQSQFVEAEQTSSVATDSSDPLNSEERSVHRHCLNVPPIRASEDTLVGPKTFSVMFKARNFDRLSREDAIQAVISAITKVDSTWQPSTTSQEVIVFVNVLRNVACLSILEKFDLYKKYNIAELCENLKSHSVTSENASTS